MSNMVTDLVTLRPSAAVQHRSSGSAASRTSPLICAANAG